MDSKWINVYGKMDLSHVFGFPLWEEGVFRILGESYNELKLIFQQYAKTAPPAPPQRSSSSRCRRRS